MSDKQPYTPGFFAIAGRGNLAFRGGWRLNDSPPVELSSSRCSRGGRLPSQYLSLK
ncbi:MAG: hypothetical protein GF344_05190 [Chitinivibrionales bacterium]|nr:hypothetical protein [Chitinivibrionales bacterium]MBD3356392.1 hypothetical protein [Chitinivibrionales bacterium]